MDINETLRLLRALARAENDRTGYVDPSDALDQLGSIAASFAELDEWLSRGGFLPEDWARNR